MTTRFLSLAIALRPKAPACAVAAIAAVVTTTTRRTALSSSSLAFSHSSICSLISCRRHLAHDCCPALLCQQKRQQCKRGKRTTKRDRQLFSSHPTMRGGSITKETAQNNTISSTQNVEANEENNHNSKYEKCVRRLYQTNLFHPVKMGLENIERLHRVFNSPMDSPNIHIVHVAGTNGKGSVALKIAKTLAASTNNKVGLFCSPHVSSFRERMQILDGTAGNNSTQQQQRLISEEEVEELLPRIFDACQTHNIPATFFEITTALAFLFYASHDVNVVVLETGLGGRLDATNVIAQPALSVITSIGLEHTRILGDTIEQIAREKAGIIKASRPVLVGPHAVPQEVFRECAREKGASHFFTCNDILGPETTSTATAKDKGARNIFISEHEVYDYDEENTRVAQAALHLLLKEFPSLGPLSEDDIKEGTSVRPPCRFEVFQDSTTGFPVVLDVAHNPPAMLQLAAKVRRSFPSFVDDGKIRIVIGMSSDKNLQQCFEGMVLQALAYNDPSKIHLVQAAHPRAAKLETILEDVPALTRGSHYDLKDRSITRQVQDSLRLAKENEELLIICGSVFLMAEAREALGFDEPRDSQYIAEVAGCNLRHGQENFSNDTTTTAKNVTGEGFNAAAASGETSSSK